MEPTIDIFKLMIQFIGFVVGFVILAVVCDKIENRIDPKRKRYTSANGTIHYVSNNHTRDFINYNSRRNGSGGESGY
ncbi:hypothetical protein [Thermoflavimicrobium dichotomicum]|uniref:Uncharacterized protein n=1 Tax=Thermoflavimicrobium dichotomicum TaxID=46223 RepID=A0A1I3U2U1_9BACL|nr:hypothetical protein [Thermoflavimicrobium dichotomicum]SFJ77245.1 hypothetical protein SAMN05421852_12137 [Thermoflavimicrobium dichotomicum]